MPDADTPLPLSEEFAPPREAAWRALVDKVLKGAEFDKRLVARTADGLAIRPLYTRADAVADAALTPRTQYFPSGWDVRQLHAGPDPKAANGAILEDLTGGATSIALQILAPGQAGLPYGAEGLAVALEGVFLDGCAIALDAGENTMDAAGSLIELWRAKDISENKRRGAFNCDPLGVLARTGTLYYPAARSCEIAAKFANDCRGMTNVTALLADGRPYHEAGASEAQELASMLATLVAYLRACEAEGLRPRFAFSKIGLALAADADLFLTVAKLRAARRLLARVAEACGATHAVDGVPLWVTTSQRMMGRRDPWVNMLRTTIACTGAALGGADAITVLPYTWAMGRPDAFARRIARNTHLVLQEESALGRVVDPAHGAWFIEKLGDDLAQTAWALFQAVEGKGGMGAALESGFIQAEVARVAEVRARDIANGRRELTGVSAFPMIGDDGVKVTPHPPADPVVTGGTSIAPLVARRLAEPFERLRDAADRHAAATGRSPQVFLACLGDLALHSVRATWARNFLAAGGIEVLASAPLHNSADAGRAFAESGAAIACIASSDAVYGELGEAAAAALKAAGAHKVLLAGRPREQQVALEAAGVDIFVHAGTDAPAILSLVQGALGIQT